MLHSAFREPDIDHEQLVEWSRKGKIFSMFPASTGNKREDHDRADWVTGIGLMNMRDEDWNELKTAVMAKFADGTWKSKPKQYYTEG